MKTRRTRRAERERPACERECHRHPVYHTKGTLGSRHRGARHQQAVQVVDAKINTELIEQIERRNRSHRQTNRERQTRVFARMDEGEAESTDTQGRRWIRRTTTGSRSSKLVRRMPNPRTYRQAIEPPSPATAASTRGLPFAKMTSLVRTSINPQRIGMRHSDDIVAAIDKMDLARHAGREI
jgi:hypothetical protein